MGRYSIYALFLGCILLNKICFAAEDTSNVYDMIGNQVASQAPKGHYSNWSDSDKGRNLKKITLSCGMLCGMAFSAPSKDSKELLKEQSMTCSTACMYKNLPNDYPTREVYKKAAMKHYEAAKDLGSNLPPPTFK